MLCTRRWLRYFEDRSNCFRTGFFLKNSPLLDAFRQDEGAGKRVLSRAGILNSDSSLG